MTSEYLKIWFADIETANEFFDGNSKHLGEFLVNVYREYAGTPTCFTSKLVEKYFKTYQKRIEFIKKAKVDGKIGAEKKAVNEQVKSSTLKGSVKGVAQGVVLPKVEYIKEESIIVKEESNNKTGRASSRSRNIFSDCFTDWFLAENQTPFKMQTKDFVALASIEKYCNENKKEGYTSLEMFKGVLENFSLLPDFFQNNKNPCFINTRLPEIIALIRQKAKSTDKKKGNVQTMLESNLKTKELIKAKYAAQNGEQVENN